MGDLRPWVTLEARTIHRDQWIDLRAERCRKTDGTIIDPYYVLHYRDWVHVLALLPDDRIVMVRQYRHGARLVAHELPGGVMDPADASADEAARREMLEETGFRVGELSLVSSLSPNPASHTNRIMTFVTRDAAKIAEPRLDAGESLEVALVPVEEVLAGLTTGLVAQSMQVSCILLGLRALGRIRF